MQHCTNKFYSRRLDDWPHVYMLQLTSMCNNRLLIIRTLNSFKGHRGHDGSLIYSYMCKQCLSPLKLWVWIPLMTKYTRYNIMWSSLLVNCDWSVIFSGYFCFLHQYNWPQWYNWNIVGSGVKYYNPLNLLNAFILQSLHLLHKYRIQIKFYLSRLLYE
jgi:hypothetical protein